jgi:hypothetical protein
MLLDWCPREYRIEGGHRGSAADDWPCDKYIRNTGWYPVKEGEMTIEQCKAAVAMEEQIKTLKKCLEINNKQSGTIAVQVPCSNDTQWYKYELPWSMVSGHISITIQKLSKELAEMGVV